MLILSRRKDERIMIDDKIEISIVEIKGDQVKIGIKAPITVKVYRHEIFEAIQQENALAANLKAPNLPNFNQFKR